MPAGGPSLMITDAQRALVAQWMDSTWWNGFIRSIADVWEDGFPNADEAVRERARIDRMAQRLGMAILARRPLAEILAFPGRAHWT